MFLPSRKRSKSAKIKQILLFCFCAFNVFNLHAVAESKYSKVQLYIDLGKSQEAASMLRTLKVLDDPYYHYYLGRIASTNKQNQKSIQHFQAAIKLNPNHARSYAAMALVKGRMGKFQDALNDLDKAISIDPGYAKAYSNRGVTRGALQQNNAAIADFSQAIRLDPRLADAYRNRGITREMIGDLRGACSDWNIASALGQEGPKQWTSTQCQ